MDPKVVTIAEVARLAGVSKTTVSHVINSTRFVEEGTRSRVVAAIKQLNYRPNHVARSLAVKQTHSVGLILTDIGNPFYHPAILGVEEVALANDYTVFLFNANYDEGRSQRFVDSMVERRVDGIVFMSIGASDRLIKSLTDSGLPVVVLDAGNPAGGNFATVLLDFKIGIDEMADHLVGLGHRRFAFVGGSDEFWSSRNRKALYVEALAARGIRRSDIMIVESNFRIDGGREALHSILGSPLEPTAVYALSDLMALGIVLEAQKIGVGIPGGLSVVGTDDIELGREHQPSLTTIALPSYRIGTAAMDLMLELIRDKDGGALAGRPLSRVIGSQLIVRRTSGPPGHPDR